MSDELLEQVDAALDALLDAFLDGEGEDVDGVGAALVSLARPSWPLAA
jgi:hypothetical protein